MHGHRQDPQCRIRRPRRRGQDLPGRGDPVRMRSQHPARACGRRDHDHRLRPRRDQAQDLAEHRGRLRRSPGPPAQPHRHPRLRRLRGRRARGPARGGSRGGGGGRGGGGAGADREGLEVRQRLRAAARDRGEPARPRTGRLPPDARVAAEAAEGPARPAAAADRERERLQRGGGPDRDAGPRAGRRQDQGRRHPGRPRGERQVLPREAHGGRRRDRRRSPRQVSGGGLDRGAGDAGRAPEGDHVGRPRPHPGQLGHARHRGRAAARPHREGVPVARRRRGGGGDRPAHQGAGQARRRSQGAAQRGGVQDDLGPARGQALRVPGLLGDAAVRQPGLSTPAATAASGSATWAGSPARPRSRWRRSGRARSEWSPSSRTR